MTTNDSLAEDDRLASLLDAYLADKQAGKAPSREKLLRQHPQMAELLEYVDALDSLAPLTPEAAQAQTAVLQETAEREAESEHRDTDAEPDFGKYELLSEIGRGGMGVVYKAWQVDLDRVVAVKMILAGHLASDEYVRRFFAEARAAARLSHSNIVSIHEVGKIHGQPYFAMDFIEGCSLADELRNEPREMNEAVACLATVARAVDYLHSQDVVHRDLKPSNILIDGKGQPHVTDFGLAKLLSVDSQQTQSGVIAGTPSYMAPEQAAGQKDSVGPTSDVYSLGAILYELLTGRPPFAEENALDTLVQVLESEPAPPRQLNTSVPRELELICLRCLEKNPSARYPSAAALADDLERYLRGENVEARPRGLWSRLRRWSRREPALVSRLVGLAIVAGVAQMRYAIGGVDLAHHLRVMCPLGIWAAVSFAFQWLLNRDESALVARYLWAVADAALLTCVLAVLGPEPGPLLIGYPLMIAASGLWFRVRFVSFMTAATIVSYIALVLLRSMPTVPFHYHFIFVACLGVSGLVVAYQVYRVRVLSRYYTPRSL